MIRAKRRVVAVLGGLALVTGILFVSPAQAATCQSVPGETIGADVKVGPVRQRVPAISNISVCMGGATMGLVTVETSGGTCTFSCLSVLVGGDAGAEGLTISYYEDGVPRTIPVSPPPVGGPDATCVLSVGSPDAPYPDCFIAIGPELDGPVGDVQEAVDDAVALACDTVPPAGSPSNDYEFCEYPHLWANAFIWQTKGTVCNTYYEQTGMYPPTGC